MKHFAFVLLLAAVGLVGSVGLAKSGRSSNSAATPEIATGYSSDPSLVPSTAPAVPQALPLNAPPPPSVSPLVAPKPEDSKLAPFDGQGVEKVLALDLASQRHESESIYPLTFFKVGLRTGSDRSGLCSAQRRRHL